MFKKSITSVILFVASVNVCLAETLLGGDVNTDSLNGFLQVAVNASTIILGLVGSLALLAFIYGGFTFLLSAGNSDKVTRAKQIIIGAVVGLMIVFTSYMIIQFVMKSMGYVDNSGKVKTWNTVE